MSPRIPAGRITLRPGFNPQDLPDLTPPVEGVAPWEYLVDESQPEAERKEYARAHNRGTGPVPETWRWPYPPRRLAPVPTEAVIASHLRQDVQFEFDGAPPVTARLTVCDEDASDVGAFPFTGPVAIIGSTPPAAAAEQALGRHLIEEIEAALQQRGIDSWRILAVDRARRWIDPSLLVDYTQDLDVRLAARVHLQPFLSVWRPDPDHRAGVIDVIDLADLDGRVTASGPARLGQITTATCPVIPGSQPRRPVHHAWRAVDIGLDHGRRRMGGPATRQDPRAGLRHLRQRQHHPLGQTLPHCAGDATTRVGPLGSQESRHDEYAGFEDPDSRREARRD